jgi:hypothetical protein
VTRLINAIIASPDWRSTAIFLAWDDKAASTTTCHPGGGLRLTSRDRIHQVSDRI